MAGLCGKAIWLAHSYDLQRAIEMAVSIDGTHLIVKVGHGPYYFPETARGMLQRVRTQGYHPLAWIQLTDYYPHHALKAVAEALTLGYEAAVLFLGPAPITAGQLRPLALALENSAIPTRRLLLATPPLAHLPDPTTIEVLAPLCQGGWMPLCFETWGPSPDDVIERLVYQTLGDVSRMWRKSPDIYPVLSAQRRTMVAPMLPEEFIPWVEAIIRHGVDFFSIYHAAATEKVLWPLVQSIKIACLDTSEHRAKTGSQPIVSVTSSTTGANAAASAGQSAVQFVSVDDPQVAQPVYMTVTSNDTVWGIITRYGMNKQQFWAWNAHLWESRGMPRDPDYLQEGWRIRVK